MSELDRILLLSHIPAKPEATQIQHRTYSNQEAHGGGIVEEDLNAKLEDALDDGLNVIGELLSRTSVGRCVGGSVKLSATTGRSLRTGSRHRNLDLGAVPPIQTVPRDDGDGLV